jgi:transcriptional regulator with XRE-family HTH domain
MSKIGGWPRTGFGGRLRALREGAGLSQRELADKTGCNQFTVAKLERGLQEPAWPLVLALAKALGVTCEAFNGEATGEPYELGPRGRPAKAPGQEPERKPKRARGRPRKAPAGGRGQKRKKG